MCRESSIAAGKRQWKQPQRNEVAEKMMQTRLTRNSYAIRGNTFDRNGEKWQRKKKGTEEYTTLGQARATDQSSRIIETKQDLPFPRTVIDDILFSYSLISHD